ncbi:Lipoxygenase [Phytophthora infestans]|uniref:Lipoxygenase n=1 Tax=Phytophthora infestans TaxID=4787 RepID=A0A833W4Z0_PHYIN|nr:Lipoxygenase [Phytophthora infestans]KAF4145110.1 Lipoxygenase [Phytophthora infestans]
MIAILLKLAVVLSTLQSVTSDLSIPDPHDGHRASIIEARSKLIHNVERTYSVGDQTFQLNPGPEVSTSSMLYFEHLVLQATALTATTNFNASKIETFLQDRLPFTSVDDFHQADENFGAMRLSILGNNLRLVQYADNLWEVPSDLILDVFGELTLSGALRTHKVFVTDFSDHGDLTYKAAKEFKYIPNVIGCFCNNVDKRQLLPLAITLVDSELTYTKADSPGEWQLAKMALHATEVNFQQMRHFVETHLISVPVQVEMMRSLSTEHPVYALMDYHLFADFGMEYFARRELLSPGTPYDQVTGYGATGSLRAVMREFKTTSVDLDLPTDLAARESLVDYRLNRYGTKYYNIIKRFVRKYMKAYYTTKEAIRDDTELQTWAERSSQLEHIHGFPSAFTGYDDLVRVLTHFIFENAIKHHFMSGHASWHSIAPPFHGSALYNKPLPTKKGEEVDPLDYAVPSETVPKMAYIYSWFTRQVPVNASALHFYQSEPFTSETELVEPIREFHQSMNDMMHFVDFAESQEAHPIDIFKPSSLPFYSFT